MKGNLLFAIAGMTLLSACVGDRLDQRYALDIPITAYARDNGDVCIYPPAKENEKQDTLYISSETDEKLIDVANQDMKKGICFTQRDYPLQANHSYSMRVNFVPVEKRRDLHDVSGRAFITHFKVKKLNNRYVIENAPQQGTSLK